MYNLMGWARDVLNMFLIYQQITHLAAATDKVQRKNLLLNFLFSLSLQMCRLDKEGGKCDTFMPMCTEGWGNT